MTAGEIEPAGFYSQFWIDDGLSRCLTGSAPSGRVEEFDPDLCPIHDAERQSLGDLRETFCNLDSNQKPGIKSFY